MDIGEVFNSAFNGLSGKWKKVIPLCLLFFIAIIVLFLLCIVPIVGPIACVILSVPLQYGFVQNLMALIDNKTEKVTSFVKIASSNFSRAWKLVGNMLVELALPIIIFVVATFVCGVVCYATIASYIADSNIWLFWIIYICIAIVIATYIWVIAKSLLLMLANMIAIDNPLMSTYDATQKSIEVMDGKRCKFICVYLICYIIMALGIVTLGIGYIWIIPYIESVPIFFYKAAMEDSRVRLLKEENDTSNENV